MWVVKLGGSLLGSPELAKWLETIVQFSDGKIIIVPGGGLFANAVREAQQISNANDVVAHQLALLAMDQFGILLAGMCHGLVTASSELEISERGWQHRGIVWLPSKMVLADERIPKNWQVTSDSLSAWLANKLGVEQLILVKSKSLTPYQKESPCQLQHLVDDEVVDSQLVNYITGRSYQTWVLNKSDYALFEQGFSAPRLKEKGLLINTTSR
jgi:aspartokinase-like uncharacterized kinase